MVCTRCHTDTAKAAASARSAVHRSRSSAQRADSAMTPAMTSAAAVRSRCALARRCRQSSSLQMSIEQPFTQAFACAQHAFGLIFRGEFSRALPLCERAVRLCESGNVFLWLPPAYAAWGWALVWAGRSAEGLSHLERSVTIIEGLGQKLYLP